MYQFIFSRTNLYSWRVPSTSCLQKFVKSETETDCTFNFHFEQPWREERCLRSLWSIVHLLCHAMPVQKWHTTSVRWRNSQHGVDYGHTWQSQKRCVLSSTTVLYSNDIVHCNVSANVMLFLKYTNMLQLLTLTVHFADKSVLYLTLALTTA